ncbi:hypothetical protein JQ625_15365 [Bradyrhizobium diazoefficiens]|nr:hypothetical protein [Bradyrhizobium diazoefficiens]MBR0776216.1 hypothetical protein [Bradyrhizobium diazoefficiens]
MPPSPIMRATCACGRVELKGLGKPIVSVVCYCDDCQKGADRIEALPNAPAVRDADGGTAYLLVRKDRFECADGAELLKPYKLKDNSPTNRVVATCCNSAVFANFDRGPFWVSVYRARFRGELPPVQYRTCTKFKPEGTVLPNDVPSSPRYSLGVIARILASRIAMALGR